MQWIDAGLRSATNMAYLRDVVRRFDWLYKIRPQSLAEPFYRLVGPRGGRAILDVSGARLFIDPFSTSGRSIVDGEEYEPDLVSLIRTRLPIGGCFLDIGANEGRVAGIAAHKLGRKGLVIAVEPQSRLRDVLEINIALNNPGTYRIFQCVVGETDGETLSLSLGPESHSGGSSLVRAYRWSGRRERVSTLRVDSILAGMGDRQVDLMKIDVEGYEAEVIRSAEGSLASKAIAVVAIDYHGPILQRRGIDPREIDAEIRGHGYRLEAGDAKSGYCVYSL